MLPIRNTAPAKSSSWERPFRYLTGIYDKVWYGEFPWEKYSSTGCINILRIL